MSRPALTSPTDPPAFRRVADGLLNQILTGKYLPGTQLPSTNDLAIAWSSSATTIHKALLALAKEGWVRRSYGAGTLVANPGDRFNCAGIYHGSDIFSNELYQFGRSLHARLVERFNQMGKATQVFVESRKDEDQRTLLPSLRQAISERRIQCLVATWMSPQVWEDFARLKMPTVTLMNPLSQNKINFDFDEMMRESATRLVAKGCKSVALIASADPESASTKALDFYDRFERKMQVEGLETRPEWIFAPSIFVETPEAYGYEQFRRLWQQKRKPDALIVYPDTVVRGVVMGVLREGPELVAKKLKFLFHRNAGINLFCPFQATWAISNEDKLAETIIRVIQKQFNGETVSSLLLPFEFEERERLS